MKNSKKHPDFRTMLPSQVKAYMVDFFIKKLNTHTRRVYGSYQLSSALADFRHLQNDSGHFYGMNLVSECFEEATKQLREIENIMIS